MPDTVTIIGKFKQCRRIEAMLSEMFSTNILPDRLQITLSGNFPSLAIVVDDGTEKSRQEAEILMRIGVKTAFIGNGQVIDGLAFHQNPEIIPERLIALTQSAISG